MLTIKSLNFDESIVAGWLNPDNHDRGCGWTDGDPPARIIMKDFNPYPMNLPCDLDDITDSRRMCHHTQVDAGCGLVEADVITRNDLAPQPIKILWEIAKQPQKPHGMAYKGAMYIPCGSANFILRVWCFEVGTTGMRDTMISAKLLEEGYDFDHTRDDWGGWWLDEYGFGAAPIRKNLSEDAKYDEMFPHHPLSLTRKYMRHIEQSLRFDSESLPYLQAPPTPPNGKKKDKGWLGKQFGDK